MQRRTRKPDARSNVQDAKAGDKDPKASGKTDTKDAKRANGKEEAKDAKAAKGANASGKPDCERRQGRQLPSARPMRKRPKAQTSPARPTPGSK
jgi:hypothetical protein